MALLSRVKLLALLIALMCTVYVAINRARRRWLHGMVQTMHAIISCELEALLWHDPLRGLREEYVKCPDGETAVVWWSIREEAVSRGQHVWVILPGGMTHGRKFYTHDAVRSGVFAGSAWCIFHNPGIISKCIHRPPAALTDCTYLLHFISVLRQRGIQVTIMGFSAGSMLGIASSKQLVGMADCVRGVVAIHGPDRIRDVFETHQQWGWGLDRVFALSLYKTMINSGTPELLNDGLRRAWFPWLKGWTWMKEYTEHVFGQDWALMEDELWNCRPAFNSPPVPGSIPVLRIVSANDPIVPFETIDTALFANLHKVIVHDAGHTCAFRSDPAILPAVRKWASERTESHSNAAS